MILFNKRKCQDQLAATQPRAAHAFHSKDRMHAKSGESISEHRGNIISRTGPGGPVFWSIGELGVSDGRSAPLIYS